jgi:hypothetical protein
MTIVIAVFAALLLLFGFHRFALWAEDRGWIYYLRRKPASSTLGNAFLEVQSLIEPSKRTLVEVRKEDAVEEDEHGEPPEAGIRGGTE